MLWCRHGIAGVSATCRLTFLLPRDFLAAPGRHQPCLAGCVLTIARDYVVAIEGPCRERVFEQAARFLRVLGKDRAPRTIGAVLASIDPPGKDTWNIILDAKIAFAASAVAPTLFGEDEIHSPSQTGVNALEAALANARKKVATG